ncbi:recombinase family protein [Nonomuraea sp. NPDC050783]|uniref:recombinase family protein n=1 Tax=Nonomuraea sp. NPDC050783 TaxID=3154634 RepID=UPI003464EBDF
MCRDLIDVHAVRDWCQARGVALRVLSGPLSNFHDLAANDATTALLINVITAVGQFQRDIQNELTVEGIAAAEAEGRYRDRPPALAGAQLEEARSAFPDHGTSIAALARAHGANRAAIRTALTDMVHRRRRRRGITRPPARQASSPVSLSLCRATHTGVEITARGTAEGPGHAERAGIAAIIWARKSMSSCFTTWGRPCRCRRLW